MSIKKENRSLVISISDSTISITVAILSIAAIIISIVAVCRSKPFDIEVSNFIIGILSLMITAYVGLQIYYTIDTKRKMEKSLQETEKTIKLEVKEMVDKRMEDYDNTINAYLIQIYTISTDLSKHDYVEALDGFMNALYRANKGSNTDPILGIMDYIDDSLSKIEGNTDEDNEMKFRIKKEKKKEYIDILTNTGIEEYVSLVERISRINSI